MTFEQEDVLFGSSRQAHRLQRCVLRSEHDIDMVWHQAYNFRKGETRSKTVYLSVCGLITNTQDETFLKLFGV